MKEVGKNYTKMFYRALIADLLIKQLVGMPIKRWVIKPDYSLLVYGYSWRFWAVMKGKFKEYSPMDVCSKIASAMKDMIPDIALDGVNSKKAIIQKLVKIFRLANSANEDIEDLIKMLFTIYVGLPIVSKERDKIINDVVYRQYIHQPAREKIIVHLEDGEYETPLIEPVYVTHIPDQRQPHPMVQYQDRTRPGNTAVSKSTVKVPEDYRGKWDDET